MTDLSWILPHIAGLDEEERKKVVLRLESLDGAGGLSASMKYLLVELEGKEGFPKKYIYKTTAEATLPRSKQLGLPREAYFYNTIAKELSATGVELAPILCATGDMGTGERTVVMEDLSGAALQSGYYFGGGSPLNWGKDLDQLTSKFATRPTPQEVSSDAFTLVAKIHRKYWMKDTFLQNPWLRALSWMRGEGEETWQASQNIVAQCWGGAKKKIEAGESKVNWDSNLVACMDASLAKTNWSDYCNELKTRQWTFVHGDLHPANILWSDEKRGDTHTILLDFEVVGVGSGAQDIAQYLISHMTPSLRKECEKELLQSYYSVLTDTTNGGVDPTTYSYEQCLEDYVRGGSERWVWLLAFLCSICPDPMVQYFQDQVAAFMTDHGVTPETVGMPRA